MITNSIKQHNLDTVDSVVLYLEDLKVSDIFVSKGRSCDEFEHCIVVTARSMRHVSAVTEHVSRALKKQHKGKCIIEGDRNSQWVILDASYFILHVMDSATRSYYQIEKIWQFNED